MYIKVQTLDNQLQCMYFTNWQAFEIIVVRKNKSLHGILSVL